MKLHSSVECVSNCLKSPWACSTWVRGLEKWRCLIKELKSWSIQLSASSGTSCEDISFLFKCSAIYWYKCFLGEPRKSAFLLQVILQACTDVQDGHSWGVFPWHTSDVISISTHQFCNFWGRTKEPLKQFLQERLAKLLGQNSNTEDAQKRGKKNLGFLKIKLSYSYKSLEKIFTFTFSPENSGKQYPGLWHI